MAVAKKQSFDTWFGTAAEKATFTSMALGDKYFETDTRMEFESTGASWVTSPIGKTGYTLKKVSTNYNRPSNTDAYAVGDAVTNSTSAAAVFQLDLSTIGAVNGQSVEIRKLAVVSSAKQATLPLFKAYLSSTTFMATNDNAALDIDDTTMEAGGSWFNLDTQNSTASNSRVANVGVHEPMILAAADNKIYGILQANNAYVPVSGEKFTIIAWVALL